MAKKIIMMRISNELLLISIITVKVNSSHSRLTLSHTIAHAEDRPPPLAFFIVF